jgi:hypothetical protein
VPFDFLKRKKVDGGGKAPAAVSRRRVTAVPGAASRSMA